MEGLFRKFFAVFLTILMVCVLFLGLLTLSFAQRYVDAQTEKSLQKETSVAAKLVDACLLSGGVIQLSDVREGFQLFSAMTENDYILVDVGGNLLARSNMEAEYALPLSTEVTQAVRSGTAFFSSTNLRGFLPEATAVSAHPCLNRSGEIYAYLFVCSRDNQSGIFSAGLRRFFILNAIIVLAVAYLIAYYFTKRTARPLRQIGQAANSFAKGDFSVRVPVSDDDDAISQLAISFNEMAGALEKTEKTRSAFIANISHDLRTPMTTIGGFIDGILDGTIPPEQEKHYLSIVSAEVKRLSRLVVVMMNVAKIEAGEVHLNLTNLNYFATACSVLFTFEKQIEAKNIQVELPEEADVVVRGDADLVHQVIYNLVDNAVKFTPEGGKLSFTFEKKPAAGMGVFTVTNSGEGISSEDISHIFDRFYKSDRSRGLDKNGIGLGLYIVKSIVDAHRGSISVSSIQGESTSFSVSLPLVKEPVKKRIFNVGGQTNERTAK